MEELFSYKNQEFRIKFLFNLFIWKNEGKFVKRIPFIINLFNYIILQVAIEGCCHNQLDQIYKALKHIEDVEKIKIDLLLICGDFQVDGFSKSIVHIFFLSINFDIYFRPYATQKIINHQQYLINIEHWVHFISIILVKSKHLIRLYLLVESMKS